MSRFPVPGKIAGRMAMTDCKVLALHSVVDQVLRKYIQAQRPRTRCTRFDMWVHSVLNEQLDGA